MRLRWPYVRRTLAAALAGEGLGRRGDRGRSCASSKSSTRRRSRASTRTPWPAASRTPSPAGSATTSTSPAAATPSTAPARPRCWRSSPRPTRSPSGDLDVALAGGVDLSIDPFEVVGFAKTGALAKGEMKVYDKDSNGFWPGEGSGMRRADARGATRSRAGQADLRVHRRLGRLLRRQGRHHPAGGRRATGSRSSRAYGRAGYGVETVSYFEGHGTGTALGDATEIEALSTARRDADPTGRAGRAEHDQGQHRPHQGGRRRRRPDQGDAVRCTTR